jgi:mRNA-degrading endonuclease RelE of RelBE toxin-antitoxin system
MAAVTFEQIAFQQFLALPERIKARVAGIIVRLEKWPDVSGAKPLRGPLAGHYRLRTGDYRLQVRVAGEEVIVERIGHRDGFYE